MDRRQKKLEKKRKKRALAKKAARRAAARRPSHEQLVVAAAARSPFGPCAVSAGWNSPDDDGGPRLVTVVVTRRLPDGDLVPAIALVDRTCLGVKNGTVVEPVDDAGLADWLEELGAPHGGMERCDVLTAQSIVYAAIDYAAGMGFSPHRDFPEALFGPRPAALAEVGQHTGRPVYLQGPHDDVRTILATLVAAVGPGNFDFLSMAELEDDVDDGDAWEDGDGDDDGNDAVIDVPAEDVRVVE
jgi:hypothetical protein